MAVLVQIRSLGLEPRHILKITTYLGLVTLTALSPWPSELRCTHRLRRQSRRNGRRASRCTCLSKAVLRRTGDTTRCFFTLPSTLTRPSKLLYSSRILLLTSPYEKDMQKKHC